MSTPPQTGMFAPGTSRAPGKAGTEVAPSPAAPALGAETATPAAHRAPSRLVPLKVAVAVLVAAPFAVTLVSSRPVLVRHTANGGRPDAGRQGAPRPTASAPRRRPSPSASADPSRSGRATPRPSLTGAVHARVAPTPSGPPSSESPSAARHGGTRSAPTRSLVSEASGRCIDVTGGEPKDGTPLRIRDCTGGARQRWTFERDGTVRSLGMCMDAAWGSSDDGTVIQLVRCHGGSAQHFALTGDGDLVNLGSYKCVDVVDQETANGTRLQLWECAGTSNQRWRAL
ncbi:ricin-type beta-trefoil lectin domain protein [Actinomadura sp. DC4]|uniref:ricin-type beta-trefoil lectin domain protein n=1 Tax=Actinomadura sp. DC4 TaxID=3055069 RepID=UPI0025B1A49D|nr:ricin-type beta-trefoil lectin domain protein [Actinomadura sp. DC4]MDN3358709.1 ricin-type beta-trefoil lectin domain protein [Actinomadura sp. DC4]